MSWNWQAPDWPRFSWDAARLRAAENEFLVGAGMFAGSIRHLPDPDRELLIVEAIGSEAVTTSEIEGEVLDRASVQSSIRRRLGLATDRRRVRPAEDGVAEMMVDLYGSVAAPLSDEILFGWHRMLLKARRDLAEVGCYRTGRDPMQIVSGPLHAQRVHFEAPPASAVPREMRRFLDWFHRCAPGGKEPLPALTRAGLAHLYFESIHPFEDGNGRLGRAISEKAFAEGVGQPTLTSLAATLLAHRKSYYAALEAANQGIDATQWLVWFAGVAIEAQRRTAAAVEFLIDKTKLLDRLRGRLNTRQEKALLRMLAEGPEGFRGGLSAANYMAITGASTATATRDLADLVEQGALVRDGERRYARYRVAIPLRPVAPVRIAADGSLS